MPEGSLDQLLERATAGEWAALGRLLTAATRDPMRVMAHVKSGKDAAPILLGFTGPPGVGKSCLVSALITHARGLDLRVAAMCVDPSSPYTGGAVLGDRVRMQAHNLDPGVYVRSFASRGQLGGLTAAVPAAVAVLASCGFDLVLIETVGVGQSETAITAEVEATVLVLSPVAGDGIQAIKSGVMEAADVIALNKSDLAGAESAANELRLALNGPGTPRRAVVQTVATTGAGIEDLWSEIERSRQSATARQPAGDPERVIRLAAAQMEADLRNRLAAPAGRELVRRMQSGLLDEWDVAAALVQSGSEGPASA